MSESTESTASGTVTLGIYENHRQVANFELGRTTEIGRRQVNEPAPYEKITLAECDRVIVAELAETAVSRKHLTFELLPTGTVTVTNDSSKNSVPILGNIRLAPGEKLTLELPIACEIGLCAFT